MEKNMRSIITIIAVTSLLVGCGSTGKNNSQSVITNLENKLAQEKKQLTINFLMKIVYLN